MTLSQYVDLASKNNHHVVIRYACQIKHTVYVKASASVAHTKLAGLSCHERRGGSAQAQDYGGAAQYLGNCVGESPVTSTLALQACDVGAVLTSM